MWTHKKIGSQKRKYEWLGNILKCSTSLDTRELWIKTILRFYVNSVRIANIKISKQVNDTCCIRYGKGQILNHFWWKHKLVGTSTIKVSVNVLQKSANQFTSICRRTSFQHKPKWLYVFLQRYLIIHVNCCSIQNFKKIGTF